MTSVQFLGWVALAAPQALCNFWTEAKATSQNYTNSKSKPSDGLLCTIFKGKLLIMQLDQVRVNNLWWEWIKLWPTGFLCAWKTLKLANLTKQGKMLWMLEGRLQNEAKEKFWRVVVAATIRTMPARGISGESKVIYKMNQYSLKN